MIGDIRIPPRSPFGRWNPQPLFVIMNIYEYELTRDHRKNTRDNDGNG
jgi:hypothetical protein